MNRMTPSYKTMALPPTTRRSNRILRWIRHVFLRLVALLVGLALLGASYEAIMAVGDTTRYPPPGQLIDVGGYRLHIDCQGESGPAVVLVTGLGGSSLLWRRVQSAIAPVSRVCVYDRAGIGWSDVSAQPRTPIAIAAELHTLLKNAGVPGPYVLVGASVGGKYIRLYAEQYPNEVAGLVLVDARHESVDVALTSEEYAVELTAARRNASLYWWFGRLGIMRLFGAHLAAAASPGAIALPPDTRILMMVRASRSQEIDAMLDESASMTANDDLLRAARPLGMLPLIVLAADSSIKQQATWRAAQEAQAQLAQQPADRRAAE